MLCLKFFQLFYIYLHNINFSEPLSTALSIVTPMEGPLNSETTRDSLTILKKFFMIYSTSLVAIIIVRTVSKQELVMFTKKSQRMTGSFQIKVSA